MQLRAGIESISCETTGRSIVASNSRDCVGRAIRVQEKYVQKYSPCSRIYRGEILQSCSLGFENVVVYDRYQVAALVIGIGSFLRFYSITIASRFT